MTLLRRDFMASYVPNAAQYKAPHNLAAMEIVEIAAVNILSGFKLGTVERKASRHKSVKSKELKLHRPSSSAEPFVSGRVGITEPSVTRE
jgi:hypothetical protein